MSKAPASKHPVSHLNICEKCSHQQQQGYPQGAPTLVHKRKQSLARQLRLACNASVICRIPLPRPISSTPHRNLHDALQQPESLHRLLQMPSRTRSCAICRKKRIKCDATLPQCLMCIRTGRECPGLPEGPLIVDMTNVAKHGMQKRKPKRPAQNVGMPDRIWTHPGDMLPQRISQRPIVTEAFYARFLAYFTSEGEGKDIRNRRTWLHSLPLLSTDGTNDALVLAVQGTAFAYCAVESGDMALRQHSWKLYGEALRKHAGYMFRPRRKHEITVHMISTSVLFSFFEAMQATNADAYCSHIYGAARMLEITKPKQCSEGVLCQIFFHLRTQLAFIHLTGASRGEPVQVRKILSGTLEYVRLPMFQRLMGHISTLADIYVKQKDGPKQTPHSASHTTVEAEIESLWYEYSCEAGLSNTSLLWEDVSAERMQFCNAFMALIVAFFSAARILLGITSPRLLAPFLDSAEHFTTILQASRYLQTHHIGCAYMRMAMPLLLVALHSPRPSQREEAAGYFKYWINKSMSGISALGLKAIYRHRASEKDASRLEVLSTA